MDGREHDREQSGRERLIRNLMASSLAQGVTIVIGFVMPRLIYESVGQTVLGLWDLGWSLLIFAAFSGLGFGPAVTYYVARQQAEGRRAAVRHTIATAWYCQLGLGLIAMVAFTGVFVIVVALLSALDEATTREMLVMALLLAATVFAGLAGDVAHGVISGCHRSSANDYIGIGADVVLAVAMVAVLLVGGGLVGLAAVTLATRVVFEAARIGYAMRLCPEMRLRTRDWRGDLVHDLLRYSVKNAANVTQELLIHQLARLMLIVTAGPAALAVFSRYATLVRQLGRTTERMTLAIRPMISSLVGLGRRSDVARLYQRAAAAAVMLTLPMACVMGVFGDLLVTVWMGPEFVVPGLAWLLVVMAAVNADRLVAMQVLGGLNEHGWVAGICMVTSLVAFGIVAAWLHPLDPLRAGVLMMVTLSAGVALPYFLIGCQRLGINPLIHIREVWFKPLISNALFLAFLYWSRAELLAGDYAVAVLAAAAGALALLLAYWLFAFDAWWRGRFRGRLLRMAGGDLRL
jgi:O-antigen/teichoic acid export membrane protein